MVRKFAVPDKHRALYAELLRTGSDPISVLCGILADENAATDQRRLTARALRPYYPRQTCDDGGSYREVQPMKRSLPVMGTEGQPSKHK